MGYRVEQLAARCDVAVDTIRYYQNRGLLPPPLREGRVALYDDSHVERLRQVRSLQRKGLTLQAIRRVVDGRLGPADLDLAAAVAAARGEDDREESMTLEQLVARSGVAAPLIQALESSGLPLGHDTDAEHRYTGADAEMLGVGLRLVESGIPISELLALAADHHAHTVGIATRAVRLFDEYVRRPMHSGASGDAAAAGALVAAFRELFPAVSSLIALHFRRVLLSVAEEHIDRRGADGLAGGRMPPDAPASVARAQPATRGRRAAASR